MNSPFFDTNRFCTQEAAAAISRELKYICCPVSPTSDWFLSQRRMFHKSPAAVWDGGRASEGQTCPRPSVSCGGCRQRQYLVQHCRTNGQCL